MCSRISDRVPNVDKESLRSDRPDDRDYPPKHNRTRSEAVALSVTNVTCPRLHLLGRS